MMNFRFTDPAWLFLLPPALAWVLWLAWKSDVQISPWRRGIALCLRLIILLALILAIAGLQWLKPMEGMNVFFVLDRSDSVPSKQQEAAREYVNRAAAVKKESDKAGVIVFGTEASIESTPNRAVDLQKVQAIVDTKRTDIAGAIRLGSAGFPEMGQKRLVVLTDGNENFGDALAAVLAAKPLGVTVDIVPLGVARGNDVSVQKLGLPNNLKKGQTFEVKIFVQADQPQPATLRLFRNDQYLGEQKIELSAGKNLFTFPQRLTDQGFYSYNVQVEAEADRVPQNNRATAFTSVRGDPRVMIVSAQPEQDQALASALRASQLEVKLVPIQGFPGTLAEMQSYDTIFLSNVAAGDLGDDMMKLLESAVRDFGVGLVCVGGDQTFAAGGYRGTPLETLLPVDMELDSKKVLPKGALVIVCHATEFPDGNRWARDIAFAALDTLGPQDEMGIVLWDGQDKWLFPLGQVGDKRAMGKAITGMNPGDMPDFKNVMSMAYEALKKSNANLKHMVVFSDGDPGAPTDKLLSDIVGDRITISTVMIGGHVTPETMIRMADLGKGRFYDVRTPNQLPQIFLKEAAVILKSAIFEDPFKPKVAAGSELIRGIGAGEFPTLRGYVASRPKPRAEIPLITDKGDPLLAHWQYGLGRSVAFTSDAKPRWARDWIDWGKYRQFWSQTAQWSLRRLENADFTTEVSIEKGEGTISVEALDDQGNYRNFLNLQTVVVGPRGERQNVRLEQMGPGRYEARFPARDVGSYLLNMMDLKDGQVRGSQVLGASVNYSPEFAATESNQYLLQRLVESGGGKVLSLDNPLAGPFQHDRQKTFQPYDLWEWLLKIAIVLFPLDVGIRRVQIDREEWLRATQSLRRFLFPWKGKPRPQEADESLAALLARRDKVRSSQPVVVTAPNPDLFKPQKPVELASGDKPLVMPSVSPIKPVAEGEQPAAPAKDQPASTTSRLLEAKKRAQRKPDQS